METVQEILTRILKYADTVPENSQLPSDMAYLKCAEDARKALSILESPDLDMKIIQDEIRFVGNLLKESLSGYQFDPSWIRPLHLSLQARQSLYKDAQLHLGRILELLVTYPSLGPEAFKTKARDVVVKWIKFYGHRGLDASAVVNDSMICHQIVEDIAEILSIKPESQIDSSKELDVISKAIDECDRDTLIVEFKKLLNSRSTPIVPMAMLREIFDGDRELWSEQWARKICARYDFQVRE